MGIFSNSTILIWSGFGRSLVGNIHVSIVFSWFEFILDVYNKRKASPNTMKEMEIVMLKMQR